MWALIIALQSGNGLSTTVVPDIRTQELCVAAAKAVNSNVYANLGVGQSLTCVYTGVKR